MIGKEIGVSEWIVVDQKKIDAFAELTYDPYFIHTIRFARRRRPRSAAQSRMVSSRSPC